MIKFRLIPLSVARMMRADGPGQTEASSEASFVQLPSSQQVVLDSKQQECPLNCELSSWTRLQVTSCSELCARYSLCLNTCSLSSPFSIWLLLVHPWELSLNINISRSPFWPPRLRDMPLLIVPTIPPGLERHWSHWIVTPCLLSPHSFRLNARAALPTFLCLMWSKLLRTCWLDGWINSTCLLPSSFRYSQLASAWWDLLVFVDKT